MNNTRNTLRLFYKVNKKNFTNPNLDYHHNFYPKSLPSNSLNNITISAFDAIRMTYYVGIITAVFIISPFYFTFSTKGKHINSPDYMLDASAAYKWTEEKIKIREEKRLEKLAKKNKNKE